MKISAPLLKIALVAAAIVATASCDSSLPTNGHNGASSSTTVVPQVVVDSPKAGTLINVGDSIYTDIILKSTRSLTSLSLEGFRVTGSSTLGTLTYIPRYAAINVAFRAGLTDTIIRRYLQPINAADTTLDSLVILAVATDSLGKIDTGRVSVQMVSGPRVAILTPIPSDSVPAGVGIAVSAEAVQPIGVGRIDIHVTGESTWPTRLDTTISQVYSSAPRDQILSGSAIIPANAPTRGKITIQATSSDINRQPGSAQPVVVFVRASNNQPPRVTQSVGTRSEITDSIQVNATGQGIASVGIVIRDSVGNLIGRDSIVLGAPFSSNAQANIGLNLPITDQGKRLAITGFAVDQSNRTGYAVPVTQQTAEPNLASAKSDSTLIVHGRTFRLARNGTIGDIALDTARGNVFLSNTAYNRLEVWQNPSKAFDSVGVAVGSLPWGLAQSVHTDTLLVANSGGTNISRVFTGSTSVAAIHEDLSHRILTRNTYVFTVTESRDETTGKVHLSGTGPISYSDRPQYITQASTGRIYYSTMPTATAPSGTIRWLDPAFAQPDAEQIWQYATYLTGTDNTYALFNVDSIAILVSPSSSSKSDELVVYDHVYGSSSGSISTTDSTVANALVHMAGLGSDMTAVLRLDVSTLGLTDTTFVATSGNRHWVAFGEGNTGGKAGRLMMAADSLGALPNFFSPLVTISDITENASDRVFGLALDKSGQTVAAHGTNSYFATVASPFHLRLQGSYQSVSNGAGIAMHPLADGISTPSINRLSFVASASGVIEVVDIAYYINRGTLLLKNPIYGPLRVSGPMPGDPPSVILKLFAMSPQGLVVIDVTAADIRVLPF